jgi:hypothetical protein
MAAWTADFGRKQTSRAGTGAEGGKGGGRTDAQRPDPAWAHALYRNRIGRRQEGPRRPAGCWGAKRRRRGLAGTTRGKATAAKKGEGELAQPLHAARQRLNQLVTSRSPKEKTMK